jgi:uncharacterized protein YunC (DUF1805 family)
MANSIQNASDAELIDIAAQCFNAMDANLANYSGVTQQQVDGLKTFKDAFSASLTTHVTKQAEAKAQTQIKDADRTQVETQLALLRKIANANGASEGAMAATGIPAVSNKAPSNATVPVGSVDTSKRLRHTIHWTEATTPDNKKRPRGSMGAEIFVKIDGPPPTDVSQCTYLALDSATPYVAEYDGADAGKMAHYMIRWRMSDGSTGAWGETISATITG